MKSILALLGPGRVIALGVCAVLGVMAVYLKFFIPGYSFSALVCLCLIALILFYTFMPMVGLKFPGFARWTVRIFSVILALGLLVVGVTEALVIRASFGDPDKMLESDKNPFWLAEDMARRGARFPDIYMACGDEDGLLPCNQKFADLLEEKKIPHTFEIGPGAHEWDFWDTYIQKGMDWLPIPKCAPGISSGHVSKD